MSLARILALLQRHLYLYKRSLARLMEIFYWPLLDLLVWGYVTVYLAQMPGAQPFMAAFLLGAMILWDILYRSQQGISISLLEEIWSRNLLNLFVSPLRPGEFLAAMMALSIFKLSTAAAVTVTLAWLIYSFDFFMMGLYLVPFVVNLVVLGWAIGIVTAALILRYGQKAEVLAWGLTFLFQPVSAVFYPVSVLPGWLQEIARYIPASHVFEGMREVIAHGRVAEEHLLWAFALNGAYVAGSLIYFYHVFRSVRERGLLLRVGE